MRCGARLVSPVLRRGGRSLGQMAREELGRVGGTAALVATLSIMIILIAVLTLVVVNALGESPWGVFSVALTIPIALRLRMMIPTLLRMVPMQEMTSLLLLLIFLNLLSRARSASLLFLAIHL